MNKIMFSIILVIALAGCGKDDGHHACYDESLVHENPCTADCPGFLGCDGNMYCNQCEAARRGIGPA